MLTRLVLESPFKGRLRSCPKVQGNANGTSTARIRRDEASTAARGKASRRKMAPLGLPMSTVIALDGLDLRHRGAFLSATNSVGCSIRRL